MSNLGASVFKRLTPECSALGPSLLLSGVIQVVLVFVVMILLLVMLVYKFTHKPTADADKEKMHKYLKWMTATATALSSIAGLVSIWHIATASKVRRCISDAN